MWAWELHHLLFSLPISFILFPLFTRFLWFFPNLSSSQTLHLPLFHKKFNKNLQLDQTFLLLSKRPIPVQVGCPHHQPAWGKVDTTKEECSTLQSLVLSWIGQTAVFHSTAEQIVYLCQILISNLKEELPEKNQKQCYVLGTIQITLKHPGKILL